MTLVQHILSGVFTGSTVYFLTVSSLGNVYVSNNGGNSFNAAATIETSLSGERWPTARCPAALVRGRSAEPVQTTLQSRRGSR